MATTDQYVLEVIESETRTGRIRCPACADTRKKSFERTLSIAVEPDKTLYNCWHCGLHGTIHRENFYEKYLTDNVTELKPPVAQIPTQLNDANSKIIAFFEGRGIGEVDTGIMPPMVVGTKWYRRLERNVESIGFVYGSPDAPEAIKWRPLAEKAFTQDGAARSFWGLGTLPDKPEIEELVICEGEGDLVALKAIGCEAVLSCPNGAPMEVSQRRVKAEDDHKFAYLWGAREILDKAKRIVLAVDGDTAGDALAEEIARRIGRAKCWRVKYPDGTKDATDVINLRGVDDMSALIENAEPMPLHGIYSAKDYSAEIDDIYLNGHGKGESTGINSVDDLFTIAPGMLTVVTGLPNSGKSEFIDQILVNLAQKSHWTSAVSSFENPPPLHIAKFSEKIVGKPFFSGVTPRMSKSDLEDAKAFIGDHFVFLESRDGAVATIDSILDRAKQAVMRLGVRALVIDPYNYIEQTSEQEHKAISEMLTKVCIFAKAHDVHVFFVAHPKAMIPRQDGTFPIPTGMHISGGPTWFAKADIGVTVHRGEFGTEIHCWKARFKWIGKQGMTYVDYDIPTGRYSDHVGGPPTTVKSHGREHYLDKMEDVDF